MTDQQEKHQVPSPTDHTALPRPLSRKKITTLVLICIAVAAGFLFFNIYNLSRKPFFTLPPSPFTPGPVADDRFELKKFTSAEEFRQYVQASQDTTSGLSFGSQRVLRTVTAPSFGESVAIPDAVGSSQNSAAPQTTGSSADRVSETNVQVQGIDEPDIVKTNGKQIFLSKDGWFPSWPQPRPIPVVESRVAPGIGLMPPMQEYQQPKTEVLAAFPPEELTRLAEIELVGQLLLDGNTLIVLGTENGQGSATAFDISQPAHPVRTWKVRFAEENQFVTARLKDGQLYIVMQSYNTQGCPVTPLFKANGEQMVVPCTDIYYPSHPVSDASTTYTAVLLNPHTGEVKKSSSIIGSSGSSVVYMSPESLYITYRAQADMVKFMYGFLSTSGQGLLPADVMTRLEKLQQYDISNQAKMVELQSVLEGHMRALNNNDRLKLENELQNRVQTYLDEHARQLEQTLIVKFDTEMLNAQATGQVPGFLLNQFSLDEYEGHLRVATTFGQSWTQFGRSESASDVYVLDQGLRHKGAVLDLGKTERIYAVRFLNDKGYVVTFRQIDPFYVLDLSDPSSPQMTGELKIPGYSSYLHPLGKERVLGVGMEDGKVKVSLFDVSSARDPREIEKYTLDEYSSELLNNHRAFLIDEKHSVFFMPGMKGGYIFSYANDQLSLVKAVSQPQVKRALFMNDYLYVLGEQGITVLDEKDWHVVKELAL